MRYPHIVCLIDAKLDRLMKARQILSSTHAVSLPSSPEIRTISALSRSVPKPKEVAFAPAKPAPQPEDLGRASTPGSPAESNPGSPAQVEPSAAEVTAKTSPLVPPSLMRVRPRKQRATSIKRALPALQRALGGSIPTGPVFVSSRHLLVESSNRTAGAPAGLPQELTAELLTQRWLGNRVSLEARPGL